MIKDTVNMGADVQCRHAEGGEGHEKTGTLIYQ
jgi:hypothetical protein